MQSHINQNQPPQAESLPLRDIHLPDAISWWPPATGWWLVLGSIVATLIIVLLVKKIRQRNQLKKSALDALTEIRNQYENNNDKKVLAQSLSVLLRRASISFYPRNNVASLTGEQWLQHLDNTSDKKGFKTSVGSTLITAPYLPDDKNPDDQNNSIDANSLISLCESWIRSQPKKQATGEQL
jgi:hypothetical protein